MPALNRTHLKPLEDGIPHRIRSPKGVQFNVFAVATFLAFAHTIDELRIGELIALPFALANIAVAVAWPRLSWQWRVASSLGFGLFWGLAVIPYHVTPLLAGLVTWQNVSGLSRLLGGVMMVGLAVSMTVERRRVTTDAEER